MMAKELVSSVAKEILAEIRGALQKAEYKKS
jgi:hypothetical protein